MEGFFPLISAFVWVVVILGLAYWCSRYLGRRFGGGRPGKYLKIIDQIQVGADRFLVLLKLQDHVYLIGISGSNIRLLSEPDDFTEEPEEENENRVSPGFQELLKAYGMLREKKRR